MKGIKKALMFLFGAAYASGWWLALLWWDHPPLEDGTNPWKLPRVAVVITTIALLFVFFSWLSDNWDKE